MPVKKTSSRASAASKRAAIDDVQAPSPSPLSPAHFTPIAQQLREWAESALGVAGAAADVSFHMAKAMASNPQRRAALTRAGSRLRALREAAGYSVGELGQAIDLEDPGLIELVEHGKVALPFEIILRLASVLGRNDPVAFVMKLTRSYNPTLWKTMEDIGIGRLVLHAGREREFANIYRGADSARSLSDEEFVEVLAFTRAAFEMALTFRGASPRRAKGRKADE